jgi:putative hemolysin
MERYLELFILLFLILLNGFFSLSEMALMSSRRVRLHQRAEAGKKGYKAALKTRENPGVFLSTIQVGITLIGILAGAFSGSSIAALLEPALSGVPFIGKSAETVSFIVVVLLTTLLSVVFGELIPKRIAIANPERIAAATVRPMNLISLIFAPIVHGLDAFSAFFIKAIRLERKNEAAITVDELRAVLAQATESGVFGEEEQDMLEGVLDLGTRRVSAYMTPRTEIEALEITDSAETVREFILRRAHLLSVPVCRGGLDHPAGVLPVPTILVAITRRQFHGVRQFLEKPILVPESLNSLKALRMLKSSAVKTAFVVDEFGGIKGTVDFTSLAEGILGKIAVSGVNDQPEIIMREDGSYLADGSTPVFDLFETLDIRFEPGIGYHTAAGFVLNALGVIPQAGDHFEFIGWRFEVVDMDGNRIDKILVERITAKHGDETADTLEPL